MPVSDLTKTHRQTQDKRQTNSPSLGQIDREIVRRADKLADRQKTEADIIEKFDDQAHQAPLT